MRQDPMDTNLVLDGEGQRALRFSFRQLPENGARHAVLLVGTGIVGGVVTSITGSGLDITTFALLVLRLRISEKIATPTSVK